MKTAIDEAETKIARGYACSIVSSARQLKLLASEAAHLWKNQECSSQLEFFLATLTPTRWIPLVCVIRDNDGIVGLVYAKERKVRGIPTGLLYADATLATMVIADSSRHLELFELAIEQLLRRPFVRGFRLLVPPGGYELSILEETCSRTGLDLHDIPAENHTVLPMEATFEAFLAKLSSKTRRNFRYFRNKAAAVNHQFLEFVPHDEFQAAARELMEQDVVGGSWEGIERGMAIFRAASRPLLVGLKSEKGEWLSILGGWYEANRVVVFLQMNSDKKYARQSLSLVMRSHVIEMLIKQGHRDLLWWAGVGAPICHYVVPVPSRWVYVDKQTFAWRGIRRLLLSQRNRIPAKFLPMTQWIIPPPDGTVVSSTNETSSSDD